MNKNKWKKRKQKGKRITELMDWLRQQGSCIMLYSISLTNGVSLKMSRKLNRLETWIQVINRHKRPWMFFVQEKSSAHGTAFSFMGMTFVFHGGTQKEHIDWITMRRLLSKKLGRKKMTGLKNNKRKKEPTIRGERDIKIENVSQRSGLRVKSENEKENKERKGSI